MKLRIGVAALFLLLAACWFGLRLGPKAANRPASMESATSAAQVFVETELKKLYQKRGQPNVVVTFAPGSTTAEPDAGTEFSVGDPSLWIVTGTATAKTASGPVAHTWLIRERWQGNRWRLKAIEIVGPKRQADKGEQR